MHAYIRSVCVLCAALSLTACAPLLSLVGTNQTLVQVMAQVERVKLAGDGASYAASSKTITDHALSIAMGSDCKVFNVISGKPVCVSKNANATPKEDAKPATDEPAKPETQPAVEVAAEDAAPVASSAGDD